VPVASRFHGNSASAASRKQTQVWVAFQSFRPFKATVANSPPRNEAQLNYVSLRSEFDYEVSWEAVKGQDERLYGTPLTAPQVTPGGFYVSREMSWRFHNTSVGQPRLTVTFEWLTKGERLNRASLRVWFRIEAAVVEEGRTLVN